MLSRQRNVYLRNVLRNAPGHRTFELFCESGVQNMFVTGAQSIQDNAEGQEFVAEIKKEIQVSRKWVRKYACVFNGDITDWCPESEEGRFRAHYRLVQDDIRRTKKQLKLVTHISKRFR